MKKEKKSKSKSKDTDAGDSAGYYDKKGNWIYCTVDKVNGE